MSNSSFLIPRESMTGSTVVADLQWLIESCSKRKIDDSVNWAAEWLEYLPDAWIEEYDQEEASKASSSNEGLRLMECRDVILGKSLIDLRRFPRATHFLQRAKDKNPESKFLYYWCRYLTYMRDRAEHNAESFEVKGSTPKNEAGGDDFAKLLQDVYADYASTTFDAFLIFLIGQIEAVVGLKEKSISSLEKALIMEPRLWPAWDALLRVVTSADQVEEVMKNVHARSGTCSSWMHEWFLCLSHQKFNQHFESSCKAEKLVESGFTENPIIISHLGACANRQNDHQAAIELFKVAHEQDPLRLENMHLYSDSLFCHHEFVLLTSLSHFFFRSLKFEWETCYIVANYYSMRGEREQSIRFFQRALRLNPSMAGIWVLIGHEFLEMKSNAAACLAYRKAVEIDPKDYRGWYGLGQMYDILKMPNYALYYYQEAHKCRPQDSRVMIALGVIYARNGHVRDAQKCFTSAYKFGDLEGRSLWHLSKLFEKEGSKDEAARAFELFLKDNENSGILLTEIAYSLQFLAKFHCDKEDFDVAQRYGLKCLEHESVAESGRSILRVIRTKLEERAKKREEQMAHDSEETMELAGSDGEDDSFVEG